MFKNNFISNLCFCIVILSLNVNAQDYLNTEFSDESKGVLPNIGLHIGLYNYKGEIGKLDKIGSIDNLTVGYQLNLNYVFWNTLGLELYGTYANLIQNQKTITLVHNFKTLILNSGLNFSLHLDNGFILPKNAKIAPFLFGGVSLINYYPFGDFKNANGDYYYYWTDGSIRDIDERAVNSSQAIIIEKDNEYETSYRGIKGDFSLFALAYNTGLGSEFKVNKWLSAEMRFAYCFTTTDMLDGLATTSGNDGYYVGSFGFVVNPNKIKKSIKKEKSEKIDINFKELINMDSDGDGVPDLSDKCGSTVPKTKVNSKGCPLVELKDSVASKTAAELSDSLVTLRNQLCLFYPDLCNSDDTDEINGIEKKKIESSIVSQDKRTIQFIVSIADKNKDGKLVLAELYEAIELYFDDKIDLSLEELKKLIDSFFD